MRTKDEERSEALEPETADLALGALAEAEETLPTEEAGEHGAKVNRAAHTAHELLLTLREYS